MGLHGGTGAGGNIFDGIRFKLAGFDPGLEEKGGARLAERFISGNHLIVSSVSVAADDLWCVKAEYGMVLVNENWIYDSLSQGVLADHEKVLYRPVRDLKGIPACIRFCISSVDCPESKHDEQRRMCDLMNTTFVEEWTLKTITITHLVCSSFEGPEYRLTIREGIEVVSHEWLEKCLETWTVVTTDKYAKSGCEIDRMESQARTSGLSTRQVHKKSATSRSTTQQYSTVRRSGGAFRQDREAESHRFSTPQHKRIATTNRSSTPPCRARSINISRNAASAGHLEEKIGTRNSGAKRVLEYSANSEDMSSYSLAEKHLTPHHNSRSSVSSRFSSPLRRKAVSDQSKGEKRYSGNTEVKKCKRMLDYSLHSESSSSEGSSSSPSDRIGTISLRIYASEYRIKLSTSVRVPYQNKTRRMTCMDAKVILRRSFMRVAKVHMQNKSLDGCFDSSNFLIDLLDNSVSLHDVVDLPHSKCGGKKDYTQYVKMVEQEVFAGMNIPDDVQFWLRLILIEENPWNPNLLGNHIYMLESHHAYGLFMSFCSTIHGLRRDKPTKYEALCDSEIFDKYIN